MRIGILEDDAIQVEFYRLWLSTAQHQGVFYPTIAAFCLALRDQEFDLLLIDRELPDGNGEDALVWGRQHLGWNIPMIVVTASNVEADIVRALRLGANDYIIKPPRYFELMARIEAQVRRGKEAGPGALSFGVYEFDPRNREVRLAGKLVELTQKEFELACYMFEHPQRLLSRVHLLETIWGFQAEIDTRTVDTHISRLRRKLKIVPENGWEIMSVYGYGYRIEARECAV